MKFAEMKIKQKKRLSVESDFEMSTAKSFITYLEARYCHYGSEIGYLLHFIMIISINQLL